MIRLPSGPLRRRLIAALAILIPPSGVRGCIRALQPEAVLELVRLRLCS